MLLLVRNPNGGTMLLERIGVLRLRAELLSEGRGEYNPGLPDRPGKMENAAENSRRKFAGD